MNAQPQIARPDAGKAAAPPPFAEPGVPHIRTPNIPGLQALYAKEVRPFFKVQRPPILAPAGTTLLFLVIFHVALGRAGHKDIGVPFVDLVPPGLLMMDNGRGEWR